MGTTQEDIKQIRAMWADLANHALEQAGQQQKVDHRSYADQNNGLQATIHEGTSVTQLRRKGIGTEISRYNDKVKQHNAQYLNQKEQHKETTLQRGFNRVEQGFDQWQKDQEAKRLERQAEQQREMKRAEQKASPNLNKGGWSR